MRNSSYYYNQYKKQQNAARSYGNHKDNLQRILNTLTDSMYDEIRYVNNELDDLQEDLHRSIRHNSRFNNVANSLGRQKELGVTADVRLRVVVQEIQEEINSLNYKRNQSIQRQQDFYQDYRNKKEEERKAFFNKIF